MQSGSRSSESLVSTGASHGRGPRAAGWFEDYLQPQIDARMKSLVVEGGVKGRAAAGPEYTRLMDGYEEQAWKEA
jgi:arsenical-resistance protein 2